MIDYQKLYKEFQERVKQMTNSELAEALISKHNGWTRARAEYFAALNSELASRKATI